MLISLQFDRQHRFWDVSPHILVLPSPLRFEYPSPLSHLSISVQNVLQHPTLSHTPLARFYKKSPDLVTITSVALSTDSLECLIAMSTGEVFVYKFEEASSSSKPKVTEDYFNAGTDGVAQTQPVEEIISLRHLANHSADGFKPVMLLSAGRGPVVDMAVCDIGGYKPLAGA